MTNRNNLPDYVRRTLDDWEFLAFTAYDWFEKMGPIVIGIDADEDDPYGAKLICAQYDYEHGRPDLTTAALLAKYDPEYEIIIQFADPAGGMRTQRLHTAPDARHPKRVWFFEMLRRAEEDPDSLEINALPKWFVEAIMKLSDMEERHEG